MSNIIGWIKANLVVAISLAICILLVPTLLVAVTLKRAPVSKEYTNKFSSNYTTANALANQKVDLPGAIYGETVTVSALMAESKVAAYLEGVQRAADDVMVGINRGNGRLNSGSDNWLLTTMDYTGLNPAESYASRVRGWDTAEVWGSLIHSDGERVLGMPALHAAQPFSAEELNAFIDVTTQEFVEYGGFNSLEELLQSQTNAERLKSHLQVNLFNELQSHASAARVYADMDPSSPTFVLKKPYNQAVPGKQTREDFGAHAFERECDFHAIREMLNIVSRANQGFSDRTGTLLAPIKRLVSIDVPRGAVGLNSKGILLEGDTNRESRMGPRLIGNNDEVTQQEGKLPELPVGLESYPAGYDFGSLRNYFVSPTGHTSHELASVRHSRLVLDVDASRVQDVIDAVALPSLDNSYGSWQTVIDFKITDIDEYEMLRNDFIYIREGVDIVRLEMVIESIWMNAWLTEHMPDETKRYMLLLEEAEEGTDETQDEGN